MCGLSHGKRADLDSGIWKRIEQGPLWVVAVIHNE
jgi:hypothetical protein